MLKGVRKIMEHNEKYNRVIEKYINQKKLRSAIMLTAPWGSGKSYYIENCLTPYMSKKDIDIISISLYGIPTVEELNSILAMAYLKKIGNKFFANNKKSRNNKKSKKNPIKVIKDFALNKAGMFAYGIMKSNNIQINNKDVISLKELYQGNDVKKVLIVLEDVERASINVIELLGYINNLLDNENMKILLVTYEDVILKKENDTYVSQNITNENVIRGESGIKEENININKEKIAYLKIKEKTISDTLKYEPLLEESIKNILLDFDKEYKLKTNKFLDSLEEVTGIMNANDCTNLRTLIFATQKTIDFFDKSIDKRDKGFFNIVFANVLRFSIILKENKEDFIYTGNYIGIDYIKRYITGDIFIQSEIDNLEVEYSKYINKWNKDNEIKDLFNEITNWYIQPQYKVEEAINLMYKRIEDGGIEPSEYKNFMFYALQAKEYVDNLDVLENAKKLCLQRLDSASFDVDEIINSHFNYDAFIEPNDQRYDEYNEFKKEFDEKVKNKSKTTVLANFNSIDELSNDIKDKYRNRKNNLFLANYNANMILELLDKASSAEIFNFRIAISGIYKYVSNKELYVNDEKCIKYILDNLDNIINNKSDKIIKHMLDLLKTDLEKVYNQISG